jgi:hypothetical protein
MLVGDMYPAAKPVDAGGKRFSRCWIVRFASGAHAPAAIE